jgi:glycosyltransferase involved in cell wall biosynthesis
VADPVDATQLLAPDADRVTHADTVIAPSADPQEASTGPGAWRGNLEAAEREWICGWAQDLAAPDRPVTLRIYDNGAPLGEVTAGNYRADLEAAGIGDGRHAFSMIVPGGFDPAVRHLITAKRADDGREIRGSPVVLEAAAGVLMSGARGAPRAAWRGQLEIATRLRLEGWAWDPRSPNTTVALVILVNGEVIARVLANRYRKDLLHAGIGDGRHAFALQIPGGLSPLSRQVIQILGEADGCEMPSSPLVIEAAGSFDPALEQVVGAALAALSTPDQRARALEFLAAQSEKLLQQSADAESRREASLVQRQRERRLGRARHQGELDTPATAETGQRRALVIDDRLPSALHDAGAVAVISHMRALRSLRFDVSFVAAEELTPDNPDAVRAHEALASQGIRCCVSPYYASVEEVLRREHDAFDLVYLHRVSNAQKYLALVRRYARRARVIFSVADLHHVRLARQAQVEGGTGLAAQSRSTRVAECLAASAADVVVTHSSAEAEWLRRAVKGVNVHVVPWAVPARPGATAWADRAGIAFIGNYGFAPNVDAARVLVTDIMPRVWREDASIECLLVGSRMPAGIRRLAGPKVEVVAHVADLASIFERVRLSAAPLRYGAGIKGKVLESLAAGVPCIMSPIAAEGLDLPVSLAAAVGVDAAQIAERILKFYHDETLSREVAQAGLTFIAAGFGEQTVSDLLKAAIEGRRAPVDAGPGRRA